MQSLTKQIGRYRRLQKLLVASVVISAGGFYFGLYRPATMKFRQLQAAVDEKNRNLESSRSKAGELPAVALEVERLRQRLIKFDRLIPRQQDLPQFLQAINSLQQQTLLTKCSLTNEPPQAIDALSTQVIHLTFEGTFADVAPFIGKVEQMDRLTRIRKLSMRGIPGRNGSVEVQMDVSIFFLEG